ncbi:MAG: isoprenylcysteine carboxylmethyltransferase family protein [Methanobacterium paludis]|nr:isoprenylcysteine carboxylmethyltransferase family protein [Methanobacterium paludis]
MDSADFIGVGVMLTWVLSELIGSIIIPKIRRRGIHIEENDKGSVWLLLIGVIASVYVVSVLSVTSPLPELTVIGGITLMMLGIILRQWSIAVLGKFYSGTVSIQKGQKVVDKGPYSLVRHPAYSGTILTVIGYAVVGASVAGIISALVICGLIYSYRIHIEEKTLTSELGEEYLEYSKRTKKLIPHVL